MQIPHFLEADHELIHSLQSFSDAELVKYYRQEPEQAKFFVAFFCRYSAITYSIIHHISGAKIGSDYVFALVWQRIFERLQQLEDKDLDDISWQNWVVSVAGELVSQVEVPPVEKIQYRLSAVSPPLRCYVQRSLNLMPPLLRLVFMMGHNWHWPIARIASHLQAEGETLAADDIPLYLAESQKAFEKNLPIDLATIYGNWESNQVENTDDFDIDTLGNIIDRRSGQL